MASYISSLQSVLCTQEDVFSCGVREYQEVYAIPVKNAVNPDVFAETKAEYDRAFLIATSLAREALDKKSFAKFTTKISNHSGVPLRLCYWIDPRKGAKKLVAIHVVDETNAIVMYENITLIESASHQLQRLVIARSI